MTIPIRTKITKQLDALASEKAKAPERTPIKQQVSRRTNLKEQAFVLFEKGKTVQEVTELLKCNYTTVWRAYNQFGQVNSTASDYVSRRASIAKNLQEKVDSNIERHLDHLSTIKLKNLTDKEIANNLAKLASVKQSLYQVERTEEGKATAPIQHFWSIIVDKGDSKLKDQLSGAVIDVPEKAVKQTTIDVQAKETTTNDA